MQKEKPRYTFKIRQKRLSRVMYSAQGRSTSYFVVLMLGLTLLAFLIRNYPMYARWFGFFLSCYGLISNDSIQTLGVFITANVHRTAWWVLWLFISLLFVATTLVSWLNYDGSTTYNRIVLEEVEEISFLQLLSPLALIFLTRMGLPVSTTFLLLSAFVTDIGIIEKVVLKSAAGYLVAFVLSLAVWSMGFALMPQRSKPGSGKGRGWFVLQWMSSGALWCMWLVQDGANMAIFLPRKMPLVDFMVFLCFVGLLLLFLFYHRGGKIQGIVNTKTGITDVRAACFVNTFYLLLLFVFTVYSKTPMSTTWLFIGLLGGRELTSSLWLVDKKYTRRERIRKSLYLIGRDLMYAFLGLFLSIGLSVLVNPTFQNRLG